jgi:hypothetical protein
VSAQGPANAGGVLGVGGVQAPPGDLANGIAAVPAVNPPPLVGGCPKDNKHWVRVRVRFQDNNQPVPAAECRILSGNAVINAGPLATGRLDQRRF